MQNIILNIIEITTNANDDKLTIIQLEKNHLNLSKIISRPDLYGSFDAHTQFQTQFSSGDESNIQAISFKLNPYFTETHDETFENLIKGLSKLIGQEFPQDKNYSHTLIISGLETLQIHWNDNTINILYHCTGQW